MRAMRDPPHDILATHESAILQDCSMASEVLDYICDQVDRHTSLHLSLATDKRSQECMSEAIENVRLQTSESRKS